MAYGFIPDKLMHDARAKGVHLLVYAALESYCTVERRDCWPGREEIAARARCSEKTVSRCVKDLEMWGYLMVKRWMTDNLKSRNKYFLRCDPVSHRQTQEGKGQRDSQSHRKGHEVTVKGTDSPSQRDSVSHEGSHRRLPKKADKAIAAWAAWNKHLGCDPRTKQHRTNSQGLPASKDLRKVLFAFVGDDPNRDWDEYFGYLAGANPWAWFDGSFSVNIVWATRPATRTKVAAEGYGDRKSSDASAAAALLASFGIPALPEG